MIKTSRMFKRLRSDFQLSIITLMCLLGVAGIESSELGAGLRVAAEPLQVGTIAAQQGLVLTDLRPDGGGLEGLFLELTSEGQRDTLGGPSGQSPAPTDVPTEEPAEPAAPETPAEEPAPEPTPETTP